MGNSGGCAATRGMNIRPCSPADLTAVVDIFRSNIPKYFIPEEESELLSFLSGEGSENYYVIELGGEIIASGGIAQNEDETVSLCWGMVRKEHLGTGVGKVLTEFRIERALERFPESAFVLATSQHTEGFYKRFRLFDG